MSEEKSHRDFLKKVIGQLERDEEALDTHIARRLREGRQRALEMNGPPPSSGFPRMDHNKRDRIRRSAHYRRFSLVRKSPPRYPSP